MFLERLSLPQLWHNYTILTDRIPKRQVDMSWEYADRRPCQAKFILHFWRK